MRSLVRLLLISLIGFVGVGFYADRALSEDASSGESSLRSSAAASPDKRAAGKDGVIALFDGKSLDGWTTQSGKPVARGWEVVDGELVRMSRGGAIYAEGEYDDFVLDFVWKIAPGVNSGIKYRVRYYEKGVRGNPGWLGCEYQIYDDARRPGPLSSTGALYDLYAPGENKRLNPPGEYNRSRIVVSGSRIEHWLNGELIVEADTASEDWKRRVAESKFAPAENFGQNRRGRIQVQDHGGQIWFKSITLRPLNGDDARMSGQSATER